MMFRAYNMVGLTKINIELMQPLSPFAITGHIIMRTRSMFIDKLGIV